MTTPAAFLFANGNAAFTDEQGQQISKLQGDGWRGLHEFLERYPDAEIHIQGANPLDLALVPYLLANIAKPGRE